MSGTRGSTARRGRDLRSCRTRTRSWAWPGWGVWGPLDGVATLVGDRLWSSTSDGPRVQRRRRTRRRWSSRYRRARGSCCHLGGGAVAGPGGAVGENVLEGGRGHHLAGAVASPMVVAVDERGDLAAGLVFGGKVPE